MIEILYKDKDMVFCVKPSGVSSETELPAELSGQLGTQVFPLHRLDVPVGGVMVYAVNGEAAARMSRKIAEHKDFEKIYLAVCEGAFAEKEGMMEDWLFKDSSKNKSFVVKKERKGVKKAILHYKVLAERELDRMMYSLVLVRLETGRSHQIRVQFSSRKHPLSGDKKYGSRTGGDIALFSHSIQTEGKKFFIFPRIEGVWQLFADILN